MSNGARTRLIASDRLLMYGNVSVAFGLCSSLSGLGLPRQECLYTKLKLSQPPVYLSTHKLLSLHAYLLNNIDLHASL